MRAAKGEQVPVNELKLYLLRMRKTIESVLIKAIEIMVRVLPTTDSAIKVLD
ncbi:MAG TPA: hypothetical protein VEL11_02105 [Candidatus Bathyarchaeia archaeon]|nr:hypothetical protein [Candidatus Bathyarchaeia archaeon]